MVFIDKLVNWRGRVRGAQCADVVDGIRRSDPVAGGAA